MPPDKCSALLNGLDRDPLLFHLLGFIYGLLFFFYYLYIFTMYNYKLINRLQFAKYLKSKQRCGERPCRHMKPRLTWLAKTKCGGGKELCKIESIEPHLAATGPGSLKFKGPAVAN